MSTFLVFVRSDTKSWQLQDTSNELARAVHMADSAIAKRLDRGGWEMDRAEYAQVYEVAGVGALPEFTYKYGVKA